MSDYKEIQTLKEDIIKLSDIDFVKVAVIKYADNEPILDIRKWFINKKGDLHPTKQGVQISQEKIKDFKEKILNLI